MILAPPSEKMIDVGEGDLYVGKPYKIPYFYETSQVKMMKEPDDPLCISFKSWKGHFYQFYLGEFHNKSALVLTSTLRDSYVFPTKSLSLEGSAEKFRYHSNKKTPIKGSFSGFYSWGKRLLKQYDTLMSHLEDDKMYFSDEVIQDIYKELVRRVKYERSSST